jgi:hypothetical protein
MAFFEWLAKTHPGIRLTPMQAAWIAQVESGRDAIWMGGVASGRSFVERLWSEYSLR